LLNDHNLAKQVQLAFTGVPASCYIIRAITIE
jgi:hypothetical protein